MIKPTGKKPARIAGKSTPGMPPPASPNPIPKAKERPASKGRVHKGRTRR